MNSAPEKVPGISSAKLLAGDEVAHPDRVALVARDIHAEEHPRAVLGDVEAAEREELVALRLDVAVEQHLLAGHVDTRLELRGRPVVGGGERGAALDAVLLALDGAAVVPPVAAARRHRQIGLERAALDLVEDAGPQALQVRRGGLGVGVLGPQVREHLLVLLGAEPLVRVIERVTVVGADRGRAGGDGGGGGCGMLNGHPSTLVEALDTGAARVDRRGAGCEDSYGPVAGCLTHGELFVRHADPVGTLLPEPMESERWKPQP